MDVIEQSADQKRDSEMEALLTHLDRIKILELKKDYPLLFEVLEFCSDIDEKKKAINRSVENIRDNRLLHRTYARE